MFGIHRHIYSTSVLISAAVILKKRKKNKNILFRKKTKRERELTYLFFMDSSSSFSPHSFSLYAVPLAQIRIRVHIPSRRIIHTCEHKFTHKYDAK